MYVHACIFTGVVGMGLAEKMTFKRRLNVMLAQAMWISWGLEFQAEREQPGGH